MNDCIEIVLCTMYNVHICNMYTMKFYHHVNSSNSHQHIFILFDIVYGHVVLLFVSFYGQHRPYCHFQINKNIMLISNWSFVCSLIKSISFSGIHSAQDTGPNIVYISAGDVIVILLNSQNVCNGQSFSLRQHRAHPYYRSSLFSFAYAYLSGSGKWLKFMNRNTCITSLQMI